MPRPPLSHYQLFKEVCAVMAWSASAGGFEVLGGHSALTLKLQFQEVTWQKYLETPACAYFLKVWFVKCDGGKKSISLSNKNTQS